jgi:hypothetical protein
METFNDVQEVLGNYVHDLQNLQTKEFQNFCAKACNFYMSVTVEVQSIQARKEGLGRAASNSMRLDLCSCKAF